MKTLKVLLPVLVILIFTFALPSAKEQQGEQEYNQELTQWNTDARRMQEERDSKTYEIYLHRDIITLIYSADYDAWILHSERHGELTDRTDDMHGLLKAIGELSSLEQAREESEDYDNYINIINQYI